MTKASFFNALLIALLVGCASAPTRYYTLPPSPLHAPKESVPFAAVALAPITMPPGYDRLALMTAATRTRIRVAGHARWTAPLKSLLRAALIQDLTAQLRPPTIVSSPGSPLPKQPAALIALTIQRFLPNTSGRVTLVASWVIHSEPGQRMISRGHTVLHIHGGASHSQAVQVMSRAAGRLAHSLALQLAYLGRRARSRDIEKRHGDL